MNKIVIVGHPDSGHTQVENHLFRCGMKAATPSRSHGLTAPQVIESICKSLSFSSIEEITNLDEYRQHTPGFVWDGLVLDLILGNLEHSLWGWADSNALFLLEYLKGLDPQLTFVLVYDSPSSVLLKPFRGLDDCSTELDFQAHLDRWTAYNSALLHYFLRNQSNCILVHAKGVQVAAEQYLSMLQARLSAPLQVPQELDKAKSATMPPANLFFYGRPELLGADSLPDGTTHLSGQLSDLAAEDFFAKDAESYLIDQCLLQHSASQHLFEQLQASSNLPVMPDVESASTSAKAAWNAFLKQRWFASQLVARMHNASQQRAVEDIHHGKEQLLLLEKIHSLEEEMASLRLEIQRHKVENQNIVATQKLLIEQRNHATQEAQSVYLLYEEKQQELKQLASDIRSITQEKTQYQNEQKLLTDKLNQANNEAKVLFQRNEEAQKELENIVLKQKTEEAAVPPMPTGAAARVKAQLSYRLGIIMTQQSKSFIGLACMPYSLLKEKIYFDKKRVESCVEILPPLHKFADAYLAERVKKQLSYRLGYVVVHNAKSFYGWLGMPFSILHQIRLFHKERAK